MKHKDKEFAGSVAVLLMIVFGFGYAQSYFQMPSIVVVLGAIAIGGAAVIALIK